MFGKNMKDVKEKCWLTKFKLFGGYSDNPCIEWTLRKYIAKFTKDYDEKDLKKRDKQKD